MPWYIPLLIFCARICDVSLGTIRTILMVRGKTMISALMGFMEVTVWVLAISGVFKYLSHPMALISYGLGFSTGIIVGIYLEKLFVSRYHAIRVINTDRETRLTPCLREKGFAVTEMEGKGKEGDVEVCFVVIPRSEFNHLQNTVNDCSPGAFITVEDLLDTFGGVKKNLYSKSPAWFNIRKFV